MDTMFEGLEVPRFDGDNYVQWSIIIKILFMANYIWDIIEDG